MQWSAFDAGCTKQGGSWWTPTQTATPEKTARRAQRVTNDHRELKRDAQDGSILADHVLSTRQQPSCATSRLLQARGEMWSVLMMRTIEMAF
ncbi:hypothetical protein [Reticulibacter mediterranei]|uniref:hypothetical protein n=1 Tax=Reticulibacter mediterranei TaxID=2778369 RepID=UPI001C689617|nr:hypothetical protein [Reticulibacter mediterranei]